jgi:hypothetical protein
MRIANVTSLLLIAAAVSAVDDSAIPVPTSGGQTASGTDRSLHSWEMPALTVHGQGRSDMRDADRVGSYGQPRWSTIRRFSEVRTYVIPKGQAEFEYWLFVKTPSKNDIDDAKAAGAPRPKAQIKQQYEAEFGLGHRLQLDLYQVYVKDGGDGVNTLDATKFELRYALADWGKIWANPTLYAEWEQAADGPDAVEFKLLLCDELTDRWMWATNFVFEQKTGGDRERGLEWNTAVAYDAIDQTLSVGVETNVAHVSALKDPAASDRDHVWEFAVGPSIRFYPVPQAHVIISEFVGLTKDTSQSKTAMIFGWEF